MLAQRLRHRVQIQTQATSLDNYGGNAGTWTVLDTVWGAVEPVTGTESRRDGQNSAQQSVRIVLRYRADVTEQCRIVWNSTVYKILSVACRDEARRWIELSCVRGQP